MDENQDKKKLILILVILIGKITRTHKAISSTRIQ